NGEVQLALGTNGKSVAALVDSCGRAGTAKAPVRSTHMPAAANLWGTYYCEDAEDIPVDPTRLIAVPHGKVLVAATSHDQSNNFAAEVLVGKPNGSLGATVLPDGDKYVVTDAARDASTGKITVLGSSQTAPYGYVMWHGTPSHFSSPRPLSAAPTGDATHEQSMTACKGRAFVAFGTPKSLQLVTISKSGHSSIARLPHTTKNDRGAVLYVNPATGHLHAAWNRTVQGCLFRCSGLMHEAQVGGGWHKPSFVTHWFGDVPTSIQVTKSGHAIIGLIRS
ncbi:MAG: hypothetical protein JO246_06590, partial [Frankiaceae bacterium]|nr:hypothetical protein [Frankiaceae bacterium]